MSDEAAFWMTAKRDGECAECEGDIRQGERMVWKPDSFKAYCGTLQLRVLGH